MSLDALRTEIRDAEMSRIDLLKWKVTLAAALCSLGLGIGSFGPSGSSKPMLSPSLALALIPVICIYIDLLCKHLNMRILVISEFLQQCPKFNNLKPEDRLDEIVLRGYEEFCGKIRLTMKEQHMFRLEDGVQMGFTYFVSFLVIVAGVLLALPLTDRIALGLSGLFGIMFTQRIEKKVNSRQAMLPDFAKKFFEKRCPMGEGESS